MRSLFSPIINLGVDDSLEYLEIRRIRIVNWVALIGGLIWFLLSMMVFFVGFYVPATIDLIGAMSCFAALWLNKKRKYTLAFYALSFGGLLCLNFIALTFGRESAAHFSISVWIVMTLFIMRNAKRSILLAMVGVISLTVLEYVFNNFEPLAKPAEDDGVASYFQYVLLPVSLGIIIVIINFFRKEIQIFEKSLREKNSLLEEQKDEIHTQRDAIMSQYEVLEGKNLQIEQQHQEITDSIKYAKRIQTAILPSRKVIEELLPESFVLYKPKDIVAGDFYWIESTKEQVLFAAADCTGHGVPGAMISVLCNGALNRSVREFGLSQPGLILDKAREIVVDEFERAEEDVRDGMDIALCSLSGKRLNYAGAHNPLWIIRNGEVLEVKANKQPIGRYEANVPYQTHSLDLEAGDAVYVFTDGFADQFGGSKGKKFKSSNLKKLLLSIQEKSMEEQRLSLNQTFEEWRGSIEQIDDVCIIGVKIP